MAELKMTGDIYEKATVTQDSSDQTKYTFTMPAKDVYVDGYFMEPVATVKRTGVRPPLAVRWLAQWQTGMRPETTPPSSCSRT